MNRSTRRNTPEGSRGVSGNSNKVEVAGCTPTVAAPPDVTQWPAWLWVLISETGAAQYVAGFEAGKRAADDEAAARHRAVAAHLKPILNAPAVNRAERAAWRASTDNRFTKNKKEGTDGEQ